MTPQLDAIGIVVKDMARARAFYALLGLDIPDDNEDHREVTLPNGLRLMFDTVELVKSFSDWHEPSGHRMGLAFLCESPTAVDLVVNQVRSAGFTVAKEPWDAFWGQRYAQVEDPDGNLVDIFAPLV